MTCRKHHLPHLLLCYTYDTYCWPGHIRSDLSPAVTLLVLDVSHPLAR